MTRWLLIGACLLFSTVAHAQEIRQRVLLTDGTVIVGVVADTTADPVVVQTPSGVEQRVPRNRVARIEPLVGRFTRTDPTRTRLVFSPTGRTLGRRGQTRLGLLSVIVPNVTHAVSSRLDIGTAGLFMFGGDTGGILVPGAKLQVYSSPNHAVAIGTTALIPVGGGEFDGNLGLTPYLAATIGDASSAVTASVTGFIGRGANTEDLEVAEGVLLSLGGEAQVSNSIKVLGEVLVPIGGDETGAVVLPGVRFFGDRFSADLFGFVAISEGDVTGFAPLGSFSYNF